MTPARLAQLLAAVAAGVLLVVSVGGFVDRDGGDDGSSTPRAAGTVAIVDFTFDPPELTTAVGDTVTWTNEDGAAHTVTSDGDGPLDSGDLAGGATYDATFDRAGTYPYICAIHPTMQGTIEVTG